MRRMRYGTFTHHLSMIDTRGSLARRRQTLGDIMEPHVGAHDSMY